MIEKDSENVEVVEKYTDISNEEYRIYVFDLLKMVRIDNPVELHLRDSGHEIIDSEGTIHHVPKGWIHLKCRPKSK